MLASFLPLVPEHHVDEDVDGYAQDVGYQEENTKYFLQVPDSNYLRGGLPLSPFCGGHALLDWSVYIWRSCFCYILYFVTFYSLKLL